MSKTRIICHIVFATKHRLPTIPKNHKKELYGYIYGLLNNMKCTLIRLNGIEDHVHILIDLNPTVAIADLVRQIKLSTNKWLRENPNFPAFTGWCEGYFVSTLSNDDIESCIQYIKNQEQHHAIYPYFTELEKMVLKNGLEWNPQNWL